MTRRLLFLTLLPLSWFAVGCIHRSPGTLHPSSSEPLSEVQLELHTELQSDVEQLSNGIGPRNAAESLEAVHAAEAWIRGQLEDAGLSARRDVVELGAAEAANLEVSFPGAVLPDEIVVIGAHYDTVRRSPGANDNASGVALLLALASRLADRPPDRTVRVVFFVNEESPFSTGIQMGSKVYAERCRARGDAIVLMLAVDSVGNYSREKGSQDRPFLARGSLPSTGNFLAFVGTSEYEALVDRVVAVFQGQSHFPSIGLAIDSKAIYRSDNAPFLWQGYPALIVSDTSEARDPHYHLPSDTASNLAYEDMARMAEGFIATVHELAGAGVALP